jgi:hypothetical protein
MKFTDSAVLLAGVTAYLFCSSSAYTNGYFQIFNLDSDVLDRNFHQAMYSGMILNLLGIMMIPIAIAGTIFLYSTIVLEIKRKISKNFSFGRKLVRLKKILGMKTKKVRPIESYYKKLFKKSGVAVFISTGFILAMLNFEINGRDSALKIKEKIVSNTYNLVSVEVDKKIYEVAHLYCGSRNCAGQIASTGEILYYPQKGFVYSTYNEVTVQPE